VAESAYAYFCIRATDLPLEEISELMGVTPSESWRRGDAGRWNPSRPDSGWCLHSPLPRTELSLHRHVCAVLELLEPRRAVVQKLSGRFAAWLVCVGYYTHSAPGLGLTATEVRGLADLGLGLDCDLYPGQDGRGPA